MFISVCSIYSKLLQKYVMLCTKSWPEKGRNCILKMETVISVPPVCDEKLYKFYIKSFLDGFIKEKVLSQLFVYVCEG